MSSADVIVVGGGPAGLAVAVNARLAGMSVTVLDRRRPPLDVACGEGVMPEGVAAEWAAINDQMHAAMSVGLTGDADVDFVRGMVPHHEGAVAMAKLVLEHGAERGHQGVVGVAFDGGGRGLALDAGAHGRADRVDVGPGSDP